MDLPIVNKRNISKSNIINLIILGVSIVLVYTIRTKFSELFVPQIPLGYYPNSIYQNNYQNNGVQPQGNPYHFNNQIYPDRIPYYPELGRPCNSVNDCGVLGNCVNGVCNAVPYNKTAFGV